jgi:Mg/Co/Ni transporter MgtE
MQMTEQAYDVDKIGMIEALDMIRTAVFEQMAPQEIAEQLERLDPDDLLDTFKAIVQLPTFQAWASENRKSLFGLLS